MKLYFFALFLFLFTPVLAQQNSFTYDGNNIEVIHRSSSNTDNRGEFVILSDREFSVKCKQFNVKEENTYAFFWLPERSQKFVLFIRKDSVNARNIAVIKNMINNQLYKTVYNYQTRMGYMNTQVQIDSRGGYALKMENDWNTRLVPLGNGMVMLQSGPMNYNPPFGSFSTPTATITRISPNEEMIIVLRKRDSGS